MVPNKSASECLVKAVTEFMNGCGCGRATFKGDGKPAIVPLQEAVKNSRQSDTILENSPKGDSQSNGAAENAVSEAEGMIRTWKMYVEEKLKAVVDTKHVLLHWLVMHAGVIITRYKTVQDGVPEDREPQAEEQDAAIWIEGRLMRCRRRVAEETSWGVFTGIVPGTREFVILTPQGALAVRTVHRFSEHKKWDTGFMSRIKGQCGR